MKSMLADRFGIPNTYRIDGKNQMLLADHEYIYHIIRIHNNEAIHMEQAALSWLLFEQGYHQIGRVIPNLKGEWVTVFDGVSYLVMQGSPHEVSSASPGEALAQFHQWGTFVQYEPSEIVSYGLWKPLWINKLDQYEQTIIDFSRENDSVYVNLLLDILPYMIGISENAIQYIQESENEWRMNEFDHKTIAFERYVNQSLDQIIWPHQFLFDHGVRDVAEAIRYYWLFEGREGENKVFQFIEDYQTIRPLSALAWRSLYARLLMPLHLMDVIGKGLFMNDHGPDVVEELKGYLNHQKAYELKFSRFFDHNGVNTSSWDLPVVQWL